MMNMGTLPISPFLAPRRLANHPPSLVNPMFIIACTATCILGSGWITVVGREDGSTLGADGVGAVDADNVGAVVVGGAETGASGELDVAASTEFESFSSDGYNFDEFSAISVFFSTSFSATTVHSPSSCSDDSFSCCSLEFCSEFSSDVDEFEESPPSEPVSGVSTCT